MVVVQSCHDTLKLIPFFALLFPFVRVNALVHNSAGIGIAANKKLSLRYSALDYIRKLEVLWESKLFLLNIFL